jgi:hypothetical protein
MKVIKEQVDEQPKIIKLFSVNYARDLYVIISKNIYYSIINNLFITFFNDRCR